ncbi:MAG: linear amide C-N hydrolase [Candidatus Nanopelagicales bacterium]
MCTSLQLRADDGTVVVGRTMEFPDAMSARISAVPRGTTGVGVTPTGENGRQWTSTHGFVGVNALGHADWLTDGMNEKGLWAGLLYMPDACHYESADGKDPADIMAIVNVVAYLLGTCADLAEVRTAMDGVVVWAMEVPGFGFAPPAHIVLHDAGGNAAVIEWRPEGMTVTDNPIGVATNAPFLDWHLTNLRNYMNLKVTQPDPITVSGVTLAPLGVGASMLGMPGDPTPPARFVRATAAVASSRPPKDGKTAEMAVFHIMNTFDIPEGLVMEGPGDAIPELTEWTAIANLTDRRYILRGYDSPNPVVIDVGSTSFDGGEIRQTDIPTDTFRSLTV